MTLSERLRKKASGGWLGGPPNDTRLEWQAADTIDALVDALLLGKAWIAPVGVPKEVEAQIDAALDLARKA